MNINSEHTIKKSAQMQAYIHQTFPIGSEFTIQEAKSMLKHTARGITTKELERYAELEKRKDHDARVIKILKFK